MKTVDFEVIFKMSSSPGLEMDGEQFQEGMLAAKMGVWQLHLHNQAFDYFPDARKLLGDTPDTLDYFVRCLHEDDRQKFHSTLSQALADKIDFQVTLRLVRADNQETHWIDMRGKVRVNEQGEPMIVSGVTLDVTERMIAIEKLRLADQQRDDFLTMLAHELRNPLAPISSAAQLMTLTQPDQEQVERSAEIIIRQIKHMVGLVDDLLDVSRATRGLITTEQKVVDIKHTIYEAIEQTTPLIQARLHRINIDLTPVEACVLGDHQRLVQVLSSLLANAAKYTSNGGNITVQLLADTDSVIVNVIDSGAGIPAELLPQIFDPFTPAKHTTDHAHGTFGLGLMLVQNLVELHRGKLNIFSNNGANRFEIQLPRIHAPVAALTASEKNPDKALRILVVDDNHDAANTLAQILQTLGHNANVKYDARSAIESAVEKAQDVFLLDIGLPEMDGNALVRYLRAQPDTAKALIIAITGYGAEENKREAMAAGFDEYLVKPVDITVLEHLISNYRSSIH
jgi:signal transduction histidine kinase/CheY-like chemotaxis protein